MHGTVAAQRRYYWGGVGQQHALQSGESCRDTPSPQRSGTAHRNSRFNPQKHAFLCLLPKKMCSSTLTTNGGWPKL